MEGFVVKFRREGAHPVPLTLLSSVAGGGRGGALSYQVLLTVKNASKQKDAVLKAKNPPTLTCRPLLTSCSAVSWKLHHLFTRTYFHPWKNS